MSYDKACIHRTFPCTVDGAGIQRYDLEPPFKLTKQRATRADARKAVKMPSFETLPRSLVPKKGQSVRSPLMHYGFLTTMDFLLCYAKDHGIEEKDPNVYDLPDMDPDEFDDDENEEKTSDEPTVIDLKLTMEAAVRHMGASHGMKFPRNSLGVQFAMKEGYLLVITMYTNYTLSPSNIPSDECIRKMAEMLKSSDGPKWYLDGINWRWE